MSKKHGVTDEAVNAMRESLKDDPEKLAEFEEALKEGRVVSWGDADTPEDVLVDDGAGSSLILIREPGKGDFGLSVTDEGGFTGITVTKEQWQEMKTKIDNFLAGH